MLQRPRPPHGFKFADFLTLEIDVEVPIPFRSRDQDRRRSRNGADGTIRFMAVRSEHAPHFLGIKMFSGSVDDDLEHLPRTAYGWKEGQTFAFLIHFLGSAQSPTAAASFRAHLIQPCSSNLVLSTSAISLAVASARPSSLLLPLASP